MKNLNFGLFISYFCANLNLQRCIYTEQLNPQSGHIMLQLSIIFMYLHENNRSVIVRFSIPSKNFHKNSPKYYVAQFCQALPRERIGQSFFSVNLMLFLLSTTAVMCS